MGVVDPGADITLLRASGDLDVQVATNLRRALDSPPDGRAVVIDLTEVTFIDSAGIGVLIGGIGRLRDRRCPVALWAQPGSVRRVLRTIGIERIVPVCERLDDAMAAVSDQPTSS